MAKPTIAKLVHSTSSAGLEFVTAKGQTFYVRSFDGKTLMLMPSIGMTMLEFAEIIAGCFEPRSTFKGVEKVTFTFNSPKISIKKEENATVSMIYQKWRGNPYK